MNTPRTISKMSDISVGHIVQLPNGRKAEVKFIGETAFAVGVWVGLELEDDSGKNDGSVQGTRYFNCDMGRGMFMKPTNLKVIGQVPPKAAPKPAAARRVSSRPSSIQAGPVSTNDPALKRRISLNAPSPSPVPRARPSSIGIARVSFVFFCLVTARHPARGVPDLG